MTYEIRDFKSSDIKLFNPQSAQCAVSFVNENVWEDIEKNGMSHTVTKDKETIFCGGIIHVWHGRSLVWSIISDMVRAPEMLYLTREVLKLFKRIQSDPKHARLEATTSVVFDAGHRWLHLLGFYPEGIMEAYHPISGAHTLYSRVVQNESS